MGETGRKVFRRNYWTSGAGPGKWFSGLHGGSRAARDEQETSDEILWSPCQGAGRTAGQSSFFFRVRG